jgi:hypothetical protein
MTGERPGLARGVDEYELRGIAREMVVTGKLAQRGGVHEPDPALNKFGERRFVMSGNVAVEKRSVICHGVDLILHPPV